MITAHITLSAGVTKGLMCSVYWFGEFGSKFNQFCEPSSFHNHFDTILEEQEIPRNTFHIVLIRLAILFQAGFLLREDFLMSSNYTKDHDCEC